MIFYESRSNVKVKKVERTVFFGWFCSQDGCRWIGGSGSGTFGSLPKFIFGSGNHFYGRGIERKRDASRFSVSRHYFAVRIYIYFTLVYNFIEFHISYDSDSEKSM